MLHLLIKDMFQLHVFIMLLFYKCKWQFYEGEEKYYVYDTSLNMRLLPLINNFKSIAIALFAERIFQKTFLQFFYSFHYIQDYNILPHPHSVDKWGREEWTLSFVSIEVKVCETRYVDILLSSIHRDPIHRIWFVKTDKEWNQTH